MKSKRIGRAASTIVGALLVGLTALTYYAYRHDIAAARARVLSGSQVVNTPCGLIEYAAVGEGPPVLVIHGAGGGFDQGLYLGRPLIGKGFKVIAPSRFGYLRASLPLDASPIAQADAHACLLDALNLPKVAVLGGSAGAPSAMQLCLRHPDRCSAMVLLVPLAFAPHPAGEPQERPSSLLKFVMNTTLRSNFLFWTATKLARSIMIETILGTPIADFRNAAPDEKERVLEVLRNILPISEREKGLRNDAAIAASLPRYDLERFTVPALIISAEDDLYGTFRGARYTAQHVRGARFVGYPTGGHLLVGHQEEVRSEVTEFLKRIPEEKHSAAR